MSKTVNQLVKDVENFCSTRDWKNDDPNQLISSILIELGELAEHYQWTSKFKDYSGEDKKEIGYEIVDVLFYLLRLAGKSGIDVEKAFSDKLQKLEAKYPVGSDWKTQHYSYRSARKNK